MEGVQQKLINNITFTYSSSGFEAFRYNFDDNPSYTFQRPIEYWRAQLAFRGFSPRGNDIEALKKRVRNGGKNTMDEKVEAGYAAMVEAARVEVAKSAKREAVLEARRAAGQAAIEARDPLNRKRKADQELENLRQAASARTAAASGFMAQAKARAKPAAANTTSAPPGRASVLGMFVGIAEQARQAAIAKDAYRTGRRVPPAPPPPRRDRVVNRRLAQNNPGAFLRECFFDGQGRDTGDEPVALPNLGPADRAHLHQAASSLRLFHETTITDVLVLGSGRNTLGAQMVKELNRQAGWPPVPYTPPNFGQQTGEDDEENEGNNEEWDVTGKWEVQCPKMAGCFGQYNPYTLSIYTSLHQTGREIYGRFDFGAYRGVFRFSTQTKDPRGHTYEVYRDDIDEFLLDKDGLPSAENPTRCYRWRGKEDGEDVIQLGEDQHLYTMTFSDW
jgi:hypothetical protein